MKACRDGLLSRGDTHSIWLHDLANSVTSRRHNRLYLVYLESEQPSLNTTKVAWQLYEVSFKRKPTNDLAFPLVDLWQQGCKTECALDVPGGRNGGMSGAGAMPVKSTGIMENKKTAVTTGIFQLWNLDDHCEHVLPGAGSRFVLVLSTPTCFPLNENTLLAVRLRAVIWWRSHNLMNS